MDTDDRLKVNIVNERNGTITAYSSDVYGKTDLMGMEYVKESDRLGQTRITTDRDGMATGEVYVSQPVGQKLSNEAMMHHSGYFSPYQQGDQRHKLINKDSIADLTKQMNIVIESAKKTITENAEKMEQAAAVERYEAAVRR